jgi:hypothetical protein
MVDSWGDQIGSQTALLGTGQDVTPGHVCNWIWWTRNWRVKATDRELRFRRPRVLGYFCPLAQRIPSRCRSCPAAPTSGNAWTDTSPLSPRVADHRFYADTDHRFLCGPPTHIAQPRTWARLCHQADKHRSRHPRAVIHLSCRAPNYSSACDPDRCFAASERRTGACRDALDLNRLPIVMPMAITFLTARCPDHARAHDPVGADGWPSGAGGGDGCLGRVPRCWRGAAYNRTDGVHAQRSNGVPRRAGRTGSTDVADAP